MKTRCSQASCQFQLLENQSISQSPKVFGVLRTKSRSSGTNRHWHYLRHVHPGDGSPGERKDNTDTEYKEHTATGKASLSPVCVLRIDCSFADQCYRNTNGTENKRLPAANAIKNEHDEYKICAKLLAITASHYLFLKLTRQWSNDVVDAGDQQICVSSDSQSFVHDGLVVTNDIDASQLCENLHKRGVHQSGSILWDGKHWLPSCSGNSLFCRDSGLDLVEFRGDPVIIATVIMQLPKNSHRFIISVFLYQLPR